MKQVDKSTTPPGNYRYTQPETGQPFEAITWQGLQDAVGNHRLGEHLDMAFGWNKQLEHDACEQNPQWNCRDVQNIGAYYSEMALTGRALWKELHEYAGNYAETPTGMQIQQAKAWMDDFRARVPNYGCGCRDHAARFMAAWAPQLQNRQSFVRWAECFHDWVNRRVGHPFWNREQYEKSPAVSI